MLIGVVGCGGFGREVMPILQETLERTQIYATLVFVKTAASFWQRREWVSGLVRRGVFPRRGQR